MVDRCAETVQTMTISELERSTADRLKAVTVLTAEDCANVDVVPKDTIFNKLNQTGVHGK
jgi:hypothetical protein